MAVASAYHRGRLLLLRFDHQDRPRVGSKYVLFLTGGNKDEAFTILTGYELRDGKVFPLDAASPTHPINQYRLKDESTLLNDLFAALSQSTARDAIEWGATPRKAFLLRSCSAPNEGAARHRVPSYVGQSGRRTSDG